MEHKRISRRAFIGTFIIGGSAALFSYTYFETNTIEVKRYEISVTGLPEAFDGCTILQLSDLHNKAYGERQEHLLDIIGREEFDIVAITGDLIDKRDPEIEPIVHLLKGLGSTPVYFVPGNHEWWEGYTVKETLLSLGVHILENSSIKVEKDAQHIWFVGVDDPYTRRDDLPSALEDVTDPAPKILLAHAPNIFPAAIEAGIDLVMVGHTHGGQFRIPFVGAIVVPGQELFPKFDYGLFSSGGTRMIINAGLGESVMPMRFNSNPEIVLITLTSA